MAYFGDITNTVFDPMYFGNSSAENPDYSQIGYASYPNQHQQQVQQVFDPTLQHFPENYGQKVEEFEEFCEFFTNYPQVIPSAQQQEQYTPYDPSPPPYCHQLTYPIDQQQQQQQHFGYPNYTNMNGIGVGLENREQFGHFYESPPPQPPPTMTEIQFKAPEKTPSPPVQAQPKKRIPAIQCHQNSFCSNCKTRKTTLWRRNGDGSVECNACNLYFRKNNRKRPLSLRKDEIAKRKRNPRRN